MAATDRRRAPSEAREKLSDGFLKAGVLLFYRIDFISQLFDALFAALHYGFDFFHQPRELVAQIIFRHLRSFCVASGARNH